MSNITSESIRVANLERECKENAARCSGASQFCNYIVSLISKIEDEVNLERSAAIKKLITSIKRDSDKFLSQKEEFLADYKKAKEDFHNLFENKKKDKPFYPEEILDEFKCADEYMKQYFLAEDSYLFQLAACTQLKNYLTKFEKMKENSDDESLKKLLDQLIEELKKQENSEKMQCNDIKVVCDELETKMHRQLANAMDLADRFIKGYYQPKQK